MHIECNQNIYIAVTARILTFTIRIRYPSFTQPTPQPTPLNEMDSSKAKMKIMYSNLANKISPKGI